MRNILNPVSPGSYIASIFSLKTDQFLVLDSISLSCLIWIM